ncbi:MAG: hypothetical protein E7222_15070 [Clostridiales bacterium]|nr:hypothetical protein [Clostridiales bacterium]
MTENELYLKLVEHVIQIMEEGDCSLDDACQQLKLDNKNYSCIARILENRKETQLPLEKLVEVQRLICRFEEGYVPKPPRDMLGYSKEYHYYLTWINGKRKAYVESIPLIMKNLNLSYDEVCDMYYLNSIEKKVIFDMMRRTGKIR